MRIFCLLDKSFIDYYCDEIDGIWIYGRA